MDSVVGRAIRERLVEARHRAGLSQDAAARAIKVRRQTVSKWETGKSSPNPRELVELCFAYDVNPDWILAGVVTVPIEAGELLAAARRSDCKDDAK